LITDPRCATPDEKTKIPGPWNVSNYADESAGTMTLLDAIANSVNTIFSQVALVVGPDNVAAMAQRMGIRSPLLPLCSITLGTEPVTPLDMATGYSTLAAQGVRHDPTGILDVHGASGGELYQPDWNGRPVVNADVANLVTYALEGVISHGTGTAAYFGRPAAGKTGTAEDYKDAWFCGYVPQLAACVWIGYPQAEIPMHNLDGFAQVVGGSVPARIWHDFMTAALERKPIQDFPTVDPTVGNVTPLGSVGGTRLDVVRPSGPTSTATLAPSPAPTIGPNPTPSTEPTPTPTT
jgi:penicillin-binding protein 1A